MVLSAFAVYYNQALGYSWWKIRHWSIRPFERKSDRSCITG